MLVVGAEGTRGLQGLCHHEEDPTDTGLLIQLSPEGAGSPWM